MSIIFIFYRNSLIALHVTLKTCPGLFMPDQYRAINDSWKWFLCGPCMLTNFHASYHTCMIVVKRANFNCRIMPPNHLDNNVLQVSYSTVVLYSRNDCGWWVEISLNTSSEIIHDHLPKPSSEVLSMNYCKILREISYCLTACLMRSVKCNRKLATATVLLFWGKFLEFCG